MLTLIKVPDADHMLYGASEAEFFWQLTLKAFFRTFVTFYFTSRIAGPNLFSIAVFNDKELVAVKYNAGYTNADWLLSCRHW